MELDKLNFPQDFIVKHAVNKYDKVLVADGDNSTPFVTSVSNITKDKVDKLYEHSLVENTLIKKLSDSYTNKEIDDKIIKLIEDSAGEILFGSGDPDDDIGKNDDYYIDYDNNRRPIFKKEEDEWGFLTNLNELDFKVHTVNELPTSGLTPNDLYFVKEDDGDVWGLWKVDENNSPIFVSGLTVDQESKINQLTQEMIDKLKDLDPSDNGVYIGSVEPENEDVLWVDTVDSVTELEEQSAVIQSLRDQINLLISRADDADYRFNLSMDSGDFKNKASNQFDDVEMIEPFPEKDKEFNEYGVEMIEPIERDLTVKHIRIKRGKFNDLIKEGLEDGELGYAKDKNLLYIGNNGVLKLLIGSSEGGNNGGETPSGSSTHIDLKESESSSTIFRIKVITDDSGEPELIIYDASIDDAEDHKVITQGAEQLKGLYVSMFYAGGEGVSESLSNPCSHNFIEIYNYKDEPVNLKGLSIQYSKQGTVWFVFPLRGIIPPRKAFTIKGARCAPEDINTTMLNIDKFDMEWKDMRLPTTGVKIFLTIGTDPCDVPNPFNTKGTASSFRDGYIDLVGIGGEVNNQTIDGYETSFPNILNNKRAIYRKYFADYNQRPANTRFGDTNNNKEDFTYVEYDRSLWVDNAEAYKPWTTKDPEKSIYFDKNSWDRKKPNMVTNSFGRDAHKTRTFNWISVGLYNEFLQYRKKGDSEWVTVESIKNDGSPYKRRTVKGFDGIWFTVHKQILYNLTEGVFEYRCGRLNTDYWSDIYEFEMVQLTNDDEFGFVMTADQQAWSWSEYEPWRIAIEHLDKWENNRDIKYPATGTKKVNWMLNVGDMTENGIRPYEWMYYYNAGKNILPNYAQINVVGNNDLCPKEGELVGKINPESFDWFYTFEHNPNNIPMYKGETMKSVYSFDYGNMHFIVVNTNNYIEEQKAWFIKDMEEVYSRDVKPRWTVVSMHDACFNIITDVDPKRDTGFNQGADPNPQKRYSWSRLFEEWGVHLVLSGHKHTYSRSKPVLENVDENGIVDPLRPIVQTLGSPNTGETQVTEISGVVYLMSQATGSKLDSNKDVPAQSIVWNEKWFAGEGGKSSSAQKYPTYIKLDFTKEKITHYSYQIKNIMPNSSYSYDPHKPIILDKERILIDTSNIIKKWKIK